MHTPPVVKRALVTLALGATVFLPVAGATASVAVLTAEPAAAASARYQIGYWCTAPGKSVFYHQNDPFTTSRVFFWRVVHGTYSCRNGIK